MVSSLQLHSSNSSGMDCNLILGSDDESAFIDSLALVFSSNNKRVKNAMNITIVSCTTKIDTDSSSSSMHFHKNPITSVTSTTSDTTSRSYIDVEYSLYVSNAQAIGYTDADEFVDSISTITKQNEKQEELLNLLKNSSLAFTTISALEYNPVPMKVETIMIKTPVPSSAPTNTFRPTSMPTILWDRFEQIFDKNDEDGTQVNSSAFGHGLIGVFSFVFLSFLLGIISGTLYAEFQSSKLLNTKQKISESKVRSKIS